MHRTEPPGDGGGEASSQLNPAAPVCALLSLFQVTVDPGIVFPVCIGDGQYRREQKLKHDGGCCFIRLLVLSLFITIPATGPVGYFVML